MEACDEEGEEEEENLEVRMRMAISEADEQEEDEGLKGGDDEEDEEELQAQDHDEQAAAGGREEGGKVPPAPKTPQKKARKQKTQLVCPAGLMGLVIGAGGRTIKDLQAEAEAAGAKVTIQQQNLPVSAGRVPEDMMYDAGACNRLCFCSRGPHERSLSAVFGEELPLPADATLCVAEDMVITLQGPEEAVERLKGKICVLLSRGVDADTNPHEQMENLLWKPADAGRFPGRCVRLFKMEILLGKPADAGVIPGRCVKLHHRKKVEANMARTVWSADCWSMSRRRNGRFSQKRPFLSG